MNGKMMLGALLACSMLAGCAEMEEEDEAALQEVLDRSRIEQMLVSYYSHFGSDENEDFAAYYTDDAVFDVNGIVSTGHEEITALYNNADGADEGESDGEAAAPEPEGRFRMIASNIEIDIDGDTATASLVWTGVMNADPYGPPTLAEQGREYDRFKRQDDGSWLISHRVVIADSGVPPFYGTAFDPNREFGVEDLNP